MNLNGHEAGNGGHRQGTPTARCAFLYSEVLGQFEFWHPLCHELQLRTFQLLRTQSVKEIPP